VPTSLTWFDQWFAGGYADRQAINQNADELATVEGQTQMIGRVVQSHADDILRMRAMFAGLVKVLEARGLVVEDELQAAIGTMWMQMNPHAQARASAPAGMPLVTCIRCQRDVAASATTITGQGSICDACLSRG
jgi:hypothetical protein